MNKIAAEVFARKVANFDKLARFGFKKVKTSYVWQTQILDNQFDLTVIVGNDSDVQTKLIERAVGEEYTLFLSDDAVGEFVGKVRQEYIAALEDIAGKCFDRRVFKSDYANMIIEYATKTYGDEPEYLWEKFPDYAVLRRAATQKWYAVIMTISYNKLGLKSNEVVEVIDLHLPPEDVQKLVDNKTIFKGYHMNKSHWITICLDGSVPLEQIKTCLDQSYLLAK